MNCQVLNVLKQESNHGGHGIHGVMAGIREPDRETRRLRVPLCPLWFICFALSISITAGAGGPAYVAGSGFDQPVRGQPLTWANGSVHYYTDQGNLSPILNGVDADVLVSDVVGRWTTDRGITLSVTQAGHLAEDVSGDNVVGYPNGTYTIPNDIQPGATSTPSKTPS